MMGRQVNQITALGAATGTSALQMPVNDVQEANIDESKQNVEMLKDKVQQQLLMLNNGPSGIMQHSSQQGLTVGRKGLQQLGALRPAPASSMAAATRDPYTTPPQKKEDYDQEQ